METRYARHERTTDETTLQMKQALGLKVPARLKDVQVYEDQECTRPVARWGWWMNSKPKFGVKSTFLNGYRYGLEWLAPLTTTNTSTK